MRMLLLLAVSCTCSIVLSTSTAVSASSQSKVDPISGKRDRSHEAQAIDLGLLEKVRPLYPKIRLERGEQGEPFFTVVLEIAHVLAEDGKERLVVGTRWIIPLARTDRGAGEILIYEDIEDELPIVRRGMFTLPIWTFSDIRLVERRWLQFGTDEVLVSLVERDSLERFRKHGLGIFHVGLPRWAAERALNVYLKEGLEAFLELAPVRPHRNREVGQLPQRISRFDIYPSLVEDSRVPGFKYYNSWEATVLVWLTPDDLSEEAVVLEIGARGLTEGIDVSDVNLFLWETRAQEPRDRPSIEQWRRSSVVHAGAVMAPQPLASAEQRQSGENIIESVLSRDIAAVEQAVEIESRKHLISALIEIIREPSNRMQRPDSVSEAMFGLGELRAEEGIGVLVEHIGFPEVPTPSEGRPMVSYRRLPDPVIENRLPAVAALTKMGEKCVPEVIAKLASTERPVEVAACVRVLEVLKQSVPVDAQLREAIQGASGPAKQRLEHAKHLLKSGFFK